MIIVLVAGALALFYGASISFGSIKAMRQNKLLPSPAATLGFTGLIIMFSALFIPFQIPIAFYALLIGIVAMHILTAKNAKEQNTPLRFILSLVIIIVTFIGIFHS